MKFRTDAPWELLYSDDLVIISDNMVDFVEKLNTWTKALKIIGLKVNMMKTKIMVSGCNPNLKNVATIHVIFVSVVWTLVLFFATVINVWFIKI